MLFLRANKRYLPQGKALDPAPAARDCGTEPRGIKPYDVCAHSVMPHKRGATLVSLDNKNIVPSQIGKGLQVGLPAMRASSLCKPPFVLRTKKHVCGGIPLFLIAPVQFQQNQALCVRALYHSGW